MSDSTSFSLKVPAMMKVSFSCLVVGSILAASSFYFFTRNKNKSQVSKIKHGLVDLIGNTPLVKLESLSKDTGCIILAKAEFLNPGGSTKDRAAKFIIEEAEKNGDLKSNGCIYEGTSGSTGISLALIALAKGYQCKIYMPDDQAIEKSELLQKLGAQVTRVRPVSIFDEDHFCRLAEKKAKEDPFGFYADQFENSSNFKAHYLTTAPEIWNQTEAKLDAVVLSSGTGGTIAGVSKFLKEKNPQIKIVLADPQGSGLYNRVKKGVCYASTEAEGTRKRHQVDSITEGVGLNRLTKNFEKAQIDDAFVCSDYEAVQMSRYLLKKEGLFLGSSSAVNCVGVVKLAKKMKPGSVIVTILCDSGNRHLTKFWNDAYLGKIGLKPNPESLELNDFIENS